MPHLSSSPVYFVAGLRRVHCTCKTPTPSAERVTNHGKPGLDGRRIVVAISARVNFAPVQLSSKKYQFRVCISMLM